MLLDLLRFVNLFTWAIVSGVVVCVLMNAIPAMGRLTPAESVRVHQAMLTDLLDRYMPALNITSNVAAILILIFFFRDLTTVAIAFYAVGLVVGLLLSIPAAAYKIPTNRALAKLEPGVVPADYAQTRQRWDRIHVVQTSAALVALACFIIAALAR